MINQKIIQHNIYSPDFPIEDVTLVKWVRGIENKDGEIIAKECSECKKCFLVKRFKKDGTSPNGHVKICEICSMNFLSPCCGSVIKEKTTLVSRDIECQCGKNKIKKEFKTTVLSCFECNKIIE